MFFSCLLPPGAHADFLCKGVFVRLHMPKIRLPSAFVFGSRGSVNASHPAADQHLAQLRSALFFCLPPRVFSIRKSERYVRAFFSTAVHHPEPTHGSGTRKLRVFPSWASSSRSSRNLTQCVQTAVVCVARSPSAKHTLIARGTACCGIWGGVQRRTCHSSFKV